jgi:hypothetical protein
MGRSASGCTFVATSLAVTPPGDADSIDVNVIGADGWPGGHVEFDPTSARVGTLRPAPEGVPVF